MSMQPISSSGANMKLIAVATPHSDGIEPPRLTEASVRTRLHVLSAQRNAADGDMKASDPRRDSQRELLLDVFA